MTILVVDSDGHVYPCDVLRFIGRTTTSGEDWTTTTRVTTTTYVTTTEGATTTGEGTTGEVTTTTPGRNICHGCDPPIPSELTVYFDAGDYASEIPEVHGRTYVLYHIGDETECKWATEAYIQTARLPYIHSQTCTPDFGTAIDVTVSGIPDSNPASVLNGTHHCVSTGDAHWRKVTDEYTVHAYTYYDGRWHVELKVYPPAITTGEGNPTYWCRIDMRTTSWDCDPSGLTWEKVDEACYDYACGGLCASPPTIQLSAPYCDVTEPRIYLYWNPTDSRWYIELQVVYGLTQVHIYRTEPVGWDCDPWVTRYTGWSYAFANSWLELRGLPSWVRSCCYDTGQCLMTREDTCTGTSWGDGDTCDPNPCPQTVCCYVYDCWGVENCENYETNCMLMGVDCHLPGCYLEAAPDWWLYYEAIEPEVVCTDWLECEGS